MISACVNGHSEFTQWPVADLVTHRDESRADVFTFFGNKCTALPWMCHLMISSCSVSESAPSTSPGCSLWAPSSGADSKLHPSVFYHFLWWNILDQRRFEGASKQQRQRKLASLRAADLNSVCVVCVCVRERETAVCVCVTAVCLYETETAAKWVPTLSVFTTTRFLIVCSYRWYTVSVPWWVSNWTKTTDLFWGFFSLKGLKSLAFLMPVLLERIWMSRLS